MDIVQGNGWREPQDLDHGSGVYSSLFASL
jgi:hypothetical protein